MKIPQKNSKASPKLKLLTAFTLAEVIIVLGIMGIVAEMTVPTLINNVQNQTIKVGAKKSFSILSQVLVQMAANNTSIAGQCSNNHTCFRALFLPYFQYLKTCDYPNNSNCITSNVLVGGWENGASVVLNDGTPILFYDYDSGCTTDQSDQPGGACGEALIDVNGPKPPNAWSKDIMKIEFTPNTVRFQAQADATYFLSN